MEKAIRFDLPKFKARFTDASGTITQLFLIKDFQNHRIFDDDLDEEKMGEDFDQVDAEEAIERYKA